MEQTKEEEKMKRFVCILLSCAILFGGMGAVSAETPKTAMTGLIVLPEGTDRDALNALFGEIAEDTGVEIAWEEKTEKEWEKEKNKRIAAGKLPDLLFNAVNDEDAAAHPGLFTELSILSFRHAPAMEEMFSNEPDTLALAVDADENIYCVPAFLGVEPACETVMFINRTWLDALNLSMPQTLADLKNTLIAFRDSDCNGNGDPNDEIPLDYCGWFGSPYSITNLIGSWGVQLINGGPDGFFAENGEVKNYAADDRYRALLLFANELYAEGLISKKATRGEQEDYLARSHGDKRGSAIVGVAFGSSAEAQFGEALKDQYVPLPPLDNSSDMLTTSEARWTYDYSGLNIRPCRASVSSGCASPEAAMRFIDAFYRPEYSEKTFRSGLSNVLPVYIRRENAEAMSPERETERAERQPYAEALSNVDMVTEYYPQAFMNYTPEEEAALNAGMKNVLKVTHQWWPRFLTGKADIPTEWDAYVQQVEEAGLPEILAIRQHAFEAYQGK